MRNFFTNCHVVVAGVTVVLLAGAALSERMVNRAAAAPSDAVRPIPVIIARVTMTDVAGVIDSGGVVQARTTATIAARIVATVREVRVSAGDRVRAGETLVVLAGEDLAAGARAARAAALAADQGATAAAIELQAAEASLALARASQDRVAVLEAHRSATAQELDDATGALRRAEARVAGASARVLQAKSVVDSARASSDQAGTAESFTTITAPFDGLVTETMVDPGNMASPGVPLLRLEDTRGFRLEVRLDESRTGEIRNGDTVPVFLGTATASINGTVVEIGRAVDADARAFLVKIALPEMRGIRSGEFGKARFGETPRRGLTIPPAAIVRRGQLTSVFVVDNGVARVRLVNLHESEVVAGLAASEVVIVSPPSGVIDGRRVSVEGRQ